MLHCFLDTNIFLQFTTFDEINWLDELKVKEVCIVIPYTVIQELDKHKTDAGSQRRSKRSRIVLRKIEEYSETEDKVIRPSVLLSVLSNNPERQWLIDNSFDPDDADDRIVGAAQSFLLTHSSDEIVLITDDTGPRLKAKSRNIKTLSLSESLRLPEEPDPIQKELEQLKRENLSLKNAQPKLSIGFLAKDGNVEREISLKIDFGQKVLSSEKIEEVINSKKKELQYDGPIRPSEGNRDNQSSDQAQSLGVRQVLDIYGPKYPSKDEVEKYNEHLEKYLSEEYSQYISQELIYQTYVIRTRELTLILDNTGSRPAKGIDIWLHFNDGVDIDTGKYSHPTKPSPPSRPQVTSLLDSLASERNKIPNFLNFSHSNQPTTSAPAQRSISVRKVNSYEVEWSCELLKHHHQDELPTLFATFQPPNKIPTAIEVDYEITSEDIIERIKGTLIIKLVD